MIAIIMAYYYLLLLLPIFSYVIDLLTFIDTIGLFKQCIAIDISDI
jgi:hypothetical protein